MAGLGRCNREDLVGIGVYLSTMGKRITKSSIRKALKSRGGVVKRTVDEIVEVIQFHRDRNVAIVLFWSLGASWEQAEEIWKEISEE